MSDNPERVSPSPSGDHPAFTDSPTVPELKELLSELREWKKFGTHLPGITRETVDTLGRYGDPSLGSRKEALFTKWLRVHKKASWKDVIIALLKSEECILLYSVAASVKRNYAYKHDVPIKATCTFTRSSESEQKQDKCVADGDKLKRKARSAITRNIDKLADVISTSFNDIVLGCAAKELISTSFKNHLQDPLTGKDMQSRVSEFLSQIENCVHLNPTYLDVFLTVLISKCGQVGKDVSKDIATEYGQKLPQYENVSAKKSIARGDTETAMVSINNNYIAKSKITLDSENQVKTEIQNLYQDFISLVTNVRLSLSESIDSLYKIAVYIEEFIESSNCLKLAEVKTIDELFNIIKPHYSFLDCELIKGIISKFLSAKTELQVEITQYIIKVEEFKKYRLQNIKTAIEEALIPKQDVTDTTCRVIIKLNEIWGRMTLKRFYDVLQYLFSTKTNILAHIEIVGGSIIISFIAPLSQSQFLINSVLSKQTFLLRIVVTQISINNRTILPGLSDNIDINYSFLEASTEGDHMGLCILLDLGANVNYIAYGFTALMIASDNGNYKVVELLLKEQADVNLQDNNGYTALLVASQNGHYQVVELLLKKQADVNLQDNNGYTALMAASHNGHYQVVELLLKEQANANLQDNNHGYTALMSASQNGHYKVVELLLKEQADVNLQTNNGVTALMLASENGHYQIVELLLKEQADVNLQANNGFTALISASLNGHYQVVELLLKEQADVNLQDNIGDGYTALMYASYKGHYQVVEFLLKGQADVNIHDRNGFTALTLASQNGYYRVVELLLKQANINLFTSNGFTALILASKKGHRQVVELLIQEEAANVNIQDNDDGCTPLMIACQSGHFQVVELLLQKQADVNIQAKDGMTALILASSLGRVEIVKLLLREPVNDNNKWLSLMAARQFGHNGIVELILNEFDSPQPDSNNSIGFKTAHDEPISESEDKDDHTIQHVLKSDLTEFEFNQNKEKHSFFNELMAKVDLTPSKRYQPVVTSSSPTEHAQR